MVPRLFGTNGIRGVVNQLLTPEFALRLGQALGATLGSPLLVAWDGRRGSPMASHALLAGLTGVGSDVRLLGPLPTPALQFACRRHGLPGIMVTASHNPPEYAGFKVVGADGIEVPREVERALEEAFRRGGFPRPPWRSLGRAEALRGDLGAYVEAVASHVDAAAIARRRPRVVVDPGHGVGTLATPRLLEALGCRVEVLNASLDGDFPGRLPEPTPANLRGLAEAVGARGADLGIAHDGDADRCIAVDEQGRVEGGERSFALIARWFLARRPGSTVVTPVSSSQAIPLIAEACGGRVEWTPVGSAHVSRAMVRLAAPLGGEENGGILYGPHQPVRDGAMAAALLVQLLAEAEEPTSSLFSSLPRLHMVRERVPCPREACAPLMAALAEDLEGARLEALDGLKVWGEGGWVLVRPSGTEPALRILAEAASEEEARALAEGYRRRVEGLLASLDLPPSPHLTWAPGGTPDLAPP